jgi:hypothetical protein
MTETAEEAADALIQRGTMPAPTPTARRAARSQLIRILAEKLVREALSERKPDASAQHE